MCVLQSWRNPFFCHRGREQEDKISASWNTSWRLIFKHNKNNNNKNIVMSNNNNNSNSNCRNNTVMMNNNYTRRAKTLKTEFWSAPIWIKAPWVITLHLASFRSLHEPWTQTGPFYGYGSQACYLTQMINLTQNALQRSLLNFFSPKGLQERFV